MGGMKMIFILILILIQLSCYAPKRAEEGSTLNRQAVIKAAVADPTRPSEAVLRDGDRKPQQIIDFSKLNPGDRVLEIAPGAGYYTALLSRVVGETGLVYAVDPARVFEFLPRIRQFFQQYQQEDTRMNVYYSIQNLDRLVAPTQVEQIWMVLYYHDTVWTGENRQLMNQRLFESLKSGGYFLLIDHHAGADFKVAETRSLHRIDADLVMQEITAAGFVLDGRSAVLSSPHDSKMTSVFDAALRGKTDRFVWRFKKP